MSPTTSSPSMPRRSSTLIGRGSSSSISSITPITDRISPIHAKSVRWKPRDGTTNCHRYCTAFVLDTKKPLTLAITPVVSDEDAADAVGRVLDRVEQLPFEVDAILADRGYYQERVIRRARALLRWFSRSSKGKTASPSTRQHTPPTGPNMRCTRAKTESFSSARGLCLLPQRRPRRERRSRPWICGDDSTDRTPKQVETLYRKRSAIETSYRTYREARATTTTPDPLIRFVLVAVGFLLRNLWLVVRWTVVARPRRGGRDLPTANSRSNWCVVGSETI